MFCPSIWWSQNSVSGAFRSGLSSTMPLPIWKLDCKASLVNHHPRVAIIPIIYKMVLILNLEAQLLNTDNHIFFLGHFLRECNILECPLIAFQQGNPFHIGYEDKIYNRETFCLKIRLQVKDQCQIMIARAHSLRTKTLINEACARQASFRLILNSIKLQTPQPEKLEMIDKEQ